MHRLRSRRPAAERGAGQAMVAGWRAALALLRGGVLHGVRAIPDPGGGAGVGAAWGSA